MSYTPEEFLNDKLKKDSHCSDKTISKVGIIGCQPGFERVGKTIQMLDELVLRAEQREDKSKSFVVLVGGQGDISQFAMLIATAELHNIKLEFMSGIKPTMGTYGDHTNGPSYNHKFSGTIDGTVGEELRKKLSELLIKKEMTESINSFDRLQETINEFEGKYRGVNHKKIPIQGRSSKKGKNNPQSGSNFHK